MMCSLRQLAVAAGAALSFTALVHAEVNTRIDVLLSSDGINFSSTYPATGGINHVEVLVRVTYTGTASPLGLASLVFQPVVSNWTGADVLYPFANGGAGSNQSTPLGVVPDAPGQYGRISPFGRTALSTATAIIGHVHGNGSGGAPAGSWLRIAQRQATSWIGGTGNTTGGAGVNIAQLSDVGRTSADPAFNPSLSVNVFRFGMRLDFTNGGPRLMTIGLPSQGFGNRHPTTGEREVYWFGSMTEATGSIRGTAQVNEATILVPSPTALGLLAALPLVKRRRR